MIENLAGALNAASTNSNQSTPDQAVSPLKPGTRRFSDVYDELHGQSQSVSSTKSKHGQSREGEGGEGSDNADSSAAETSVNDDTSASDADTDGLSASDGADAKPVQKKVHHLAKETRAASWPADCDKSVLDSAIADDAPSTVASNPTLKAHTPAQKGVDAKAEGEGHGDLKAADDVDEITLSVFQSFIGSLLTGAPDMSGGKISGVAAEQVAGTTNPSPVAEGSQNGQYALWGGLSVPETDQPLTSSATPTTTASGLATALVVSQPGQVSLPDTSFTLSANNGSNVDAATGNVSSAPLTTTQASTSSSAAIVSDVVGSAKGVSNEGFPSTPSFSKAQEASLSGMNVKVVSGISVTQQTWTDKMLRADAAAPSPDGDRGHIDLNTYLSLNWGSRQSEESQAEKLSGTSQSPSISQSITSQSQKSDERGLGGGSSIKTTDDQRTAGADAASPLGSEVPGQMAPKPEGQGKDQSSGHSNHSAPESSGSALKEGETGAPLSSAVSFEQQVAQPSEGRSYQGDGVTAEKGGASKVSRGSAVPGASDADTVTKLSVRSEGAASDSRTLSMTVKTANSSEVRIKVTNENDGTSSVLLQGANEATSHELTKSHADLVRALEAAGVNTSHMKIEVAASNGTNSDSNGSGAGSDQQNMMDWDGQGFSGGGQNNQRNSPPKNMPSNPVMDYPTLSEAPSGPATLNAGSLGTNGSTNNGLNITV